VSDELTRGQIESALQTVANLLKMEADDPELVRKWEQAWNRITQGIWLDLAVTVVDEEGLTIRVLPEVPMTGPDRLDAIAITFAKTDTRRHQLLRLAHEWRTNP
jgi:hypothetical protein